METTTEHNTIKYHFRKNSNILPKSIFHKDSKHHNCFCQIFSPNSRHFYFQITKDLKIFSHKTLLLFFFIWFDTPCIALNQNIIAQSVQKLHNLRKICAIRAEIAQSAQESYNPREIRAEKEKYYFSIPTAPV